MSKIALLNDSFRKTFSGGRVVTTAGVHALPAMVKAQALIMVAEFDDFNEEKDPHGEHDFGTFYCVADRSFGRSTTTTSGASSDRGIPRIS